LTWLTNISKRKAVSVGPPQASGWNCTEKKGLDVCTTPSLEKSLALRKNVFHSAGSDAPSTAKLFLWGGGEVGWSVDRFVIQSSRSSGEGQRDI
jgi:hypothetical protein